MKGNVCVCVCSFGVIECFSSLPWMAALSFISVHLITIFKQKHFFYFFYQESSVCNNYRVPNSTPQSHHQIRYEWRERERGFTLLVIVKWITLEIFFLVLFLRWEETKKVLNREGERERESPPPRTSGRRMKNYMNWIYVKRH